jgi:hypothetical protein
MAFTGIEEFMKKKEAEFMKYVDASVIDRFKEGTPITLEEFHNMRLNSYERKYLFPLFDDELLLWHIEYSLMQEGNRELFKYDLPKHYTDAVLRQYLPELIRRFKNEMAE